MTTTIEFKPFPKIPRLRRRIVVTEKIDGTNALVHVTEDGIVSAGSRTRWITPQSDNFGFAAWVERNVEQLRALGPGFHQGEWYGPKIQRGYGIEERRFALFNSQRWSKPDSGRPECCQVVPELAASDDIRVVEEALEKLREGGSVLVPGFMRPEGVVVYHSASGTLFKVLLENDALPKGKETYAERTGLLVGAAPEGLA